MYLLLTSVLVILTGGLVSTLVPDRRKPFTFAAFYIAGASAISIFAFTELLHGLTHSHIIPMPFPIGNIALIIDPLSSFFIFFIAVMGIPGVLYATGYLKPYMDKGEHLASHYFFLGTFFSSILIIPLIQNAIAFLIAWEIMSLSSFFLVIFESKKEEVLSAGINYLITMHVSVIFLIIGFIGISLLANSYNFSAFSTFFASNRYLTNIIFIIFFIGFGLKSGFIPFHTWLPKAHPAAPSHISGIMSGVMIKIGIYGILRILLLIKTPSIEISYFFIIISALTALFGILNAIAQSDIKRLLAYSSIENIGIIGIGIGIGMVGLTYKNELVAFLGFTGALFHLLNHSIFKELLFFGAGSIYTKTHTRNSEKLGGLIKSMPFTGAFFLIGSIAIAALPPFNGFASEFLIYMGLLNGYKIHDLNLLILFSILLSSLALVGTMALLCFSKIFGIVFLGHPRSELPHPVDHDVSLSMLIPKFILGILIVMIGLFPQVILNIIIPAVNIFISSTNLYYLSSASIRIMNLISLTSFLLLLILILTFGIRMYIMHKKVITKYKTWDCGYQAGNTKMQYTAHSYSTPFMEMLSNIFIKKTTIEKPEGFFPKKGHFKFRLNDSLEFYMIKPLIRGTQNILGKFIWIQSGDTQMYILYGFIFLILAIIGAFLF